MTFMNRCVTREKSWKGRVNLFPPTSIFGLISILVAILLLAGTATGANWYVRAAAQGAASGMDWSNAWNPDSIKWASVQAGDTIWLAGGSYPDTFFVGASGNAGNPISILRATASDSAAVSAAGWQASFDSQVQIPCSNQAIEDTQYSHVVIDGRTQYGILLTIPMAGGYGIECDPGAGVGKPVTDLTFRNIDILGPYAWASNPGTVEAVGFKIDPSDKTLSNVVIDHCRIRGCATGLHCLVSNLTLEYSTLQDFWPAWGGSNPDHPDVMYCYPSPNMVWRYNTIINSQSDGIFFDGGGAQNFQFYGNVYYNTITSMITFKNVGQPYGPVFIYNNTFAAPSASAFGWITTNGSTTDQTSQVYNNIFFNVTNNIEISATDYNAYNYTELNGYQWPGPGGYSTESHSITFSGDPFVNLPAYSGNNTTPQLGDFHLTVASRTLFENGLPLKQDNFINFDLDGKERGSGGHWYIGAYQDGSSGIPAAPRNFRVSQNSQHL